jgi:hypothetical protein
MIEATVRFNLTEFNRYLNNVERTRMPSVIRNALNDTVKSGRLEVQKEMDRVFDRPTPYAKRGVIYDAATKENLKAAVVITGDRTKGALPATAFLGPQIEGGYRTHKAFERQLIQRGVMKQNEVAVPSREITLDRYGNMTQGFINRFMADLQIEYRGAGATRVRTDTSVKRNKNYRTARFFVPRRGSSLFPGVWQRDPSTKDIKPVVLFLRRETYRVRLKLRDVVERHAKVEMPRNFERHFNRLMKPVG